MSEAAFEDAGFVTSSKYRTDVLFALAERPATPTTIEADVTCSLSHVSRTLGELRERGLAELMVNENRKKGRIYGLTEQGEETVERLREMGEGP